MLADYVEFSAHDSADFVDVIREIGDHTDTRYIRDIQNRFVFTSTSRDLPYDAVSVLHATGYRQ